MNDDEAPNDIQDTFKQIYRDELFHAKGFRLIAGDDYYNQASANHARLGLIV